MPEDNHKNIPVKDGSQSAAIPIRYFRDESELPHNVSYSLGGTIYGTTPGGTRIIYSRETLLRCKDSPLARTPPKFLNDIPEEILKNPNMKPNVANGSTAAAEQTSRDKSGSQSTEEKPPLGADGDMFDMDED